MLATDVFLLRHRPLHEELIPPLSLRPISSIRALCLYRAEEPRAAIGLQAGCW